MSKTYREKVPPGTAPRTKKRTLRDTEKRAKQKTTNYVKSYTEGAYNDY